MLKIVELLWRRNVYVLELVLSRPALGMLRLLEGRWPTVFINFVQKVVQKAREKRVLYRNEFLQAQLISLIKSKILSETHPLQSIEDFCVVTKYIDVLI